MPGGAPGGQNDPPLLPHRHRQLAPDLVPEPARGALRRAARDRPAHRGRDRGAPGRQGRPHPDQGELAGRRAGDRRAVPGVAGRRAGRRRGTWDLRDPARAGGAQREHPGPVDPRALPRTLPGVPLRCRRRVLDRQRGHDAPQPGPTRRGAAAGGRAEARRLSAHGARLVPRPRDAVLDAQRGRLVVAVAGSRLGCVAGARPPGRDDASALAGGVTGRGPVSEQNPDGDILAAGAVLWRAGGEIALVHRPRYGDWSLPKGKLESGESMAAAAVRELQEETGVAARLGAWLRDVRYAVADGRKFVRYWSAEALSSAEFTPNDEVDELRWVSPDIAKG